jgi:hypothetical protein
MLDFWRESNLSRKPASFVILHGLLKLAAIVLGFAGTTLSLMALAGVLVERVILHLAVGVFVAVLVPAIIVQWLRPKEDPLVALGLRSETYALLLFGFAVAFVVLEHDRTAPLMLHEADRAAREGLPMLARAERFLARPEPR